MQKKSLSFLGVVLIIAICVFIFYPKSQPIKKDQKPNLPLLSSNKLPKALRGLKLRQGNFHNLIGWEAFDLQLKNSMEAFQKSCRVFLNHKPDDFVGNDYIVLYARDWFNVCHAAQDVNIDSVKALKEFFEYWFLPVEFIHKRKVTGLFTGYYIPVVAGSLEKDEKYKVPLYTVPNNLITANPHAFIKSMPSKRIVGRIDSKKLIPYYTREEINKGALKNQAEVLAYVETEIDRLKIETEGSAVIDLGDAEKLVIGFAATNGAPYKSIASTFVENKILSKHEATMKNMKEYFLKYPEKVKSLINQNKSFVFFRKLPADTVVGSQGVALSGETSLAVDRDWIPLGLPLWVTTSIYDKQRHEQHPFDKLMIAQDVGGSIKGIVRGDIYFGEGLQAEEKALSMYSKGHYWLLLPRLDR
jgi:membrane-bound lytic murein transglycosylase A